MLLYICGMENKKLPTLEEIEKAVGDMFFGKTKGETKKGVPYVKKLGDNSWEISTGHSTAWMNDAGKKMFDEAMEELAAKIINNSGAKEIRDEAFKNELIFGEIMKEKQEHTKALWGNHLKQLYDQLLEEKRILEGQILTFRQLLKNGNEGTAYYWLEEYDKHFGIEMNRAGKDISHLASEDIQNKIKNRINGK